MERGGKFPPLPAPFPTPVTAGAGARPSGYWDGHQSPHKMGVRLRPPLRTISFDVGPNAFDFHKLTSSTFPGGIIKFFLKKSPQIESMIK